MNFHILIILLSLISGFAKPALAEEILSQNAAGVVLLSVDEDNTEHTNESSLIEPTINIKASDAAASNAEAAPTGWQVKTQEVMIKALSLTGIKYTWGGKTPETGFDCSGFVSYVFRHAVNMSLPSSALALSRIGKTVGKSELQPGDLVFFNTLQSAFSHVGIYIGNNKFIHAPRTGRSVSVESMQSGYWAKRFTGAQRLDKVAN